MDPVENDTLGGLVQAGLDGTVAILHRGVDRRDFATWRRDLSRKAERRPKVDLELEEGALLIEIAPRHDERRGSHCGDRMGCEAPREVSEETRPAS